MTKNSVNTKKIVKNTLFLYIRMIVIMAVGLYTVRAILHQLGVVNYGIYNVVGGVVTMFSFINSTLTTSSQRYFSIELAKGDSNRLNQWFCLNITTFSIFILAFIVIAETLGLWFVNTQMVIPPERLYAANVVYQFSIISFCIHFFKIPYNALIIAHERMSAFAYMSIIEALLKLVIVFLLMISPWDKLIVYGFLMLLVSCAIMSSYIIYDIKHFEEAKFHPYWNKKEIEELLGFSGWHFFGTFSVIVRSQGINILLNLFFNPAINAARAVAFQILHAVNQLSSNFFVAVKPQIYKSYASGDFVGLHKLVMRSTIMCSLLVSILVYPVLFNIQYILGIWLHQVPNYTVIFTQLVLINALIDSTNGPTIAAALATGRIRKYQEVVAMLIFLNLPISYVALKFGAEPTVTMQVSICLSFVTAFARAYMLRSMIGFPFGSYVILFTKLIIASLVIWGIIYISVHNIADNFLRLIIHSIIIVIIVVLIYLVMVFDKDDVKYLFKFIRHKV